MDRVRKAAQAIGRLVRREIGYYAVRPTHLLLFLTYRCTSRCKTCTMWQRKTEQQQELSLEEWKRFIDMAAPYGIRNVELFGGDALLRKDVLIPLTAYIRARGIPEVDLVTNCNLMDKETAARLAEAGLSTYFISVDGVDEAQDHVRGSDKAFQKVRDAIAFIKASRKNGSPRIALNCTVSALNVDGFDTVLGFAQEQGVDAVAFEYAGEFPDGAVRRSAVDGILPRPYFVSQGKSILVGRAQAIALKEKLRAVKARKNKSACAVITKNIDVLKLDNLVTGEFPNRKCYICRYMVTVDPFGNILPCAFFNEYHLGSVRTESFEQIWKNKRHRDFIRAVDAKKVELCRYCIVGVERNPTVPQELTKLYFQATGRGYDE